MQPYFTRRKFLKMSAFASMAFATSSFSYKKYQPLLSFSTLGCPDWTFDTILSFAVDQGFKGIEIRGIQRQLDLTKCPEFSTKENILTTKKKVADKGLKIVNLGASANLHLPPGTDRDKNFDEAKRFIDLAAQIDCSYIRVFPNNLPKEQDKAKTLELISQGLLELGDHAKNGKVKVLMETHGDVVYISDIEHIMSNAKHSNVGLVWDIVNMWSVTKESPAEAYARLKKHIYHTHIKDMKMIDGKISYTLLGKGESPVFEAIDLLAKDKYKGFYSFEWEKLWHPEIEEPDVAIADYAKVMKQHFG